MMNMDPSAECFYSILTSPNQRIIAWSRVLIHDKSSVDRGQVPFLNSRTLLTPALNTFPYFIRDIPLCVFVKVREKPSKLIQYEQDHQDLCYRQDN